MVDGQLKDARRESVLDVTEEQLARTYAQALLGAAGGDGGSADAVAELEAIVSEVLDSHPGFAATLGSAFLDHDQRAAMLDRVFGGRVSTTMLNFLKVLSAHGRTGLLRGVARQARRLLNESQGRADVVLRVAHEIDSAVRERVAMVLRERLGIEPVMRIEVDPSLIGGLEVRVGDKVFDGTVRTAFARAHREIVRQTVEAIEKQPERFTLAQ